MYFKRLKELHKEMNMTQKQISELLGINQRTYSRYERGIRTIPARYVVKLADFYGVSVDYILGRTLIKEPYPKKRR